MWKSQSADVKQPSAPKSSKKVDDDDWETDPDFINDVGEKGQRWGSKSNPPTAQGGQTDHDLESLRKAVINGHEEKQKEEYKKKETYSTGYGGKFGVQEDRMDKSAVGFDNKK
ncbi:hypothetical protein M427DRAFT_209479 [Gonapodya prolifera JEL478]|uniref:Uncharacterized protein n=1 Tax=Gonapodya prolifera (strain JEL478) TaxID=1344416 RepID=A0A139ANR2_GONPJ|nr:hypothetical protein M427DRAFT_209479 [Gonapodya prolifera JEL478]|eukprot:KXS18391.1 hypothetical protein M427DRAFT_209479 [Gonapodya prolifera JEL478]